MSVTDSVESVDESASGVPEVLEVPDTSDALEILSNNGRHASLAVLCGWLDAIIVGRAAKEILDNGVDALPERCGLWAAPSFGWLVSRIPVGRKARGPRGTILRLPVRLEWSRPIMVVAGDEPVPFSWSTVSMGHSGVGTTFVVAESWRLESECSSADSGIPISASVPVLDRTDQVRYLRGLMESGQMAEWEFVDFHKSAVESALNKAHIALSREVAKTSGVDSLLFDRTKIETVVTFMLYGEGDHPGKVRQILNRILDPENMRKCDPLRYIYVALGRDSTDALRQAAGDPRIGSRIRSVHRDLGCPDVESLVEAFRSMYPKAHLSHSRAMAALSVVPDPMASAYSLTDRDVESRGGLYDDPDDVEDIGA